MKPLLGGPVGYIGELDQEMKLAFLGKASALVNPVSWAELFGLVMIEALACGTPVIALRREAVPEIADDGLTGAVCGDLDELALRLREIPRFNRRACRRTAERRFSIERMAKDHASLFRSLIAEGRFPR